MDKFDWHFDKFPKNVLQKNENTTIFIKYDNYSKTPDKATNIIRDLYILDGKQFNCLMDKIVVNSRNMEKIFDILESCKTKSTSEYNNFNNTTLKTYYIENEDGKFNEYYYIKSNYHCKHKGYQWKKCSCPTCQNNYITFKTNNYVFRDKNYMKSEL